MTGKDDNRETSRPVDSGEDGVGFDFDEHVGGDELADLQHAGGGADSGKNFTVGAADFFPVRDVHDIKASAHHVVEGGAGFEQGGFDIFDGLQGLDVNIANADDIAVGSGGGRAGDGDDVADTHGSGIADDGLPRGAAGNILTSHVCFSFGSFPAGFH
jgi:hypothetical protein